ncbi:hypothetical protein AMECASPLE_000266 [Ameca splendens]|uniref:Uncharacterized protein n=1 Tax=Ameca splendens TaxID=208324 RepID=A0ABV0Z7E6_9TELE
MFLPKRDGPPVVTVLQERCRCHKPILFLKAIKGSRSQTSKHKMQPPADTSSPSFTRSPTTPALSCCVSHGAPSVLRSALYSSASRWSQEKDLLPRWSLTQSV